MSLLNAYLVLSTLLILFVACIWSTKNLLNVSIKIVFFIATFLGAVTVARAMFL